MVRRRQRYIACSMLSRTARASRLAAFFASAGAVAVDLREFGQPDWPNSPRRGDGGVRCNCVTVARTANLTVMSSRLPSSFALRLLLLALVAFGLVAKPMLAAACDIADLQLAAAPAGLVMSATASDAGDADCCPMQHCGQCCMHVTAASPAVQLTTIEPIGTALAPMPSRTFRPTSYPVALRPPIAA